ncbi:Macrolide export protein MacA [Methyloligella halotolerans]|uniref:Macrolide export protein MacA n=1 Tax=Methyloligella halotolerans TaxID=1177755 RepID=A0A1E2RWU5_9HYPH|nr:efflux RND transporter periplasmic adaptor subunit [Methyloligella halotolerans]ODA66600.1 Macrolide export protein MacA [Methyloligella halotolerans]
MRLVLIVLAILIAGGAGYYYWESQSQNGFEVQTAPAKRGDIRRAVSTTGTVTPLVTVNIGSQLSGNIGVINVDYSDKVKAGDVLARIEPSTFETKVKEERAAVAIAKANAALQGAEVDKAEANLIKANLDLDRAKKLVQRGASSQAALDEAVAAQAGAEALAIAKANVENARATVDQKEATLENAEVDLARTYIRSPIDGVVIEKAVEVGQTVAASFTAPELFVIAQDLSQVQIEAEVDEADIGQVKASDRVSFTVDAYPFESFEGKVDQIRLAPTDLENVVTYTVIITAANRDGKLLPGMTANVSIVTGEHDDVVTVPSQALRFEPRGAAEALVQPDDDGAEEAGRGNSEQAKVIRQLNEYLDLDEERIARIRDALEAEFERSADEQPGLGVPSRGDEKERNRLRRNNVLRTQLSAEEFRQFEMGQRQAQGRRGTVWLYRNGKLVPVEVRLGLADATDTEVQEGLDAGTEVVIRVREKSE